MGIWIRKQDRTDLIKVERIFITNDTEIRGVDTTYCSVLRTI